MKLGKSSSNAGAKMEIGSQRRAGARLATFKRSRSFRVSAKFMCKIRSHANIRRFVDGDAKSDLVGWSSAESPDRSVTDGVTDREPTYRPQGESETSSDLRTLVQDVRSKLSLADHGSKRRDRTETTEPSKSTSGNGNCFTDGGGKNYLIPIDESYTYENPTFSLDGSLDSSVSGCLYPVGNAEEAVGNAEGAVGNAERASETDRCGDELGVSDMGNDEYWKNSEPVTIVVGNEDARSTKKSAVERNRGESVVCDSTNCRSREKLPIAEAEASSRSQPIVGRRPSFRFGASSTTGKNSGKSIIGRRGSSGLLGIVSNGSKSQTFQGMEFLEGFGKKKHHHQSNQSNSLGTNINPLTAQPSLNIHVHALFSAVEHGRLDKARTILESTDVDVNSVNSDGLSPLDVAVLNNDRALANMLVAFGAHEGNRFTSPESLGSHLGSLLLTAERRVQELGGNSSGSSIFEAPSGSCRSGFSNSHNSLTGCGDVVEDKQLALWEKRVRALRKMLLGFDQARPPDMSFHVAVDVIGTSSVLLKLQVSDLHDSSIGTKFKVQWSNSDDFTNLRGEKELLDIKDSELRIDGLAQAQRYHFRAAVGNIKGWSRFKLSTPAHVSPSSWRDLEGKLPRYSDRLDQLETLFSDIRRPEYSQQTSVLQRRNHKKKTTTIKQLFTATSKFQKNLKRGIFLATLFYHEDKILVTNEDFLPVIEVDETYSPGCMYNDFHWLMKVACTWEDVKSLKQDMEKCQGSSMNHLKLKLLQAAAQMQTALCVQDLGQIYYKPIRDTNGTVVISTVNYIKSPKSVSILNGRWLPLNKVIKKTIAQENGNVADILMASIQSQMTYHQLSSIKLTRGLYLGYLKMQSSVDLVHIFVPAKAPNVLPHCKIRDNPHVSAEEWDYLKRMTRLPSSETSHPEVEQNENSSSDSDSTEHQKLFVDMVSATSRRLFSHMSISAEDSNAHRLYDAEVIELTSQVSMIVVVPPAEMACSAPGTREELLLKRDDLFVLPIQVFEMLHLSSYHRKIIDLYSRLSCVLELDIAQAQHNHREAFSSLELSVAKERLAKLQDIQCRVNTIWKEARWLIDLITFARDRTTSGQLSVQGVSMKNLLDHVDKSSSCSSSSSSCSSSSSSSCGSNGNSLKRSLLQLPPRDPKLVKSSPGRGSWPGPNMTNSSAASACNLLTNELSKSEQQLPNGGASGHYTRKCGLNGTNYSVDSARPGEGNSERFVPQLNERSSLSKSEDSLLLTNYKHSPRNRSVNSLTCPNNAGHSINGKQIIYGSTFMGVSTTLTGGWNVQGNKTDSDGMHPANGRDEYTVGNTGGGHAKSKSSKPSASVAAVAAPTIDNQLDMKKDDATLMPAPLPGILQVYAAYETGLASGTSLKLHVTPRTTAREVVDLVVKQLNMAVVLKGEEGPIYTADELPNFCLVAVIGARERCLRDDFKPLQLQNPWKKGRLYVRQKQDVLAALEHSSKHTAFL